MNTHHPSGVGATWKLSAKRPLELVKRVMTLLDAAIRELDREEQTAKCTVLQAVSLLREQIAPQNAAADAEDGERLLAWQARKVREYVDDHIAGPIRVAELCALIQRSEGHFSRACKRTFGVSPHAFVVQRRVELAALYMIETDACLSDIALRCGFTDQAHLSKLFRQAIGETPAAWRRARRLRPPPPVLDQSIGSKGQGRHHGLARQYVGDTDQRKTDSDGLALAPGIHDFVTQLGSAGG
jgi:AraC family transcriptional regulator